MHNSYSHKVCIAPMMAWTDRHFRAFMRCISPNLFLYTEMVTAPAVIHGDRDKLLGFAAAEHPVALQLGGSDPAQLAECSRIVADYGYDEVNLNVGCPSDKVQSGKFGACLMKEPDLVADCVQAMQQVVQIPVTVKCRIGVDDQDSYQHLYDFTAKMQSAGVNLLIVHARKAWLQGLSPRQNREVPPLCYDRVYQLQQDFPNMQIIINGGIRTLQAVSEHLVNVGGVMIGRAAYEAPEFLAAIDNAMFAATNPLKSETQWVQDYIPYIIKQLGEGVPLRHMTKHLLGLFAGRPGARRWRRYLSENTHRAGADETVLLRALSFIR